MLNNVARILRIPPEATDSIIQYLRDDLASMGACSLTCSAWTPPVQAYLFRNIHISSFERAKAFLSLLETSPHLALYARTLEIKMGEGEKHMEIIIPSIVPQFTEVRALRYSGVQFCDLSDQATSALYSNFPQVRSLSFERCRFTSCDDLVAMMLSSKRVERLWLNEAEWVRPVEESSVNPELWGAQDARLPLSCVTMRRVDRGLVECLLSPELKTRLDCMVLHPIHGQDQVDENAERGINVLCDTLHDVDDIIPSIPPPPDPVVHSLRVKFDLSLENPSRDYASWMWDVLAHLDSPAFSEIVINIVADNREQLEKIDLGRVGKAIARSSFGDQNKVHIVVEGGLAEEHVEEEIARRMGNLGKRLLDLRLIH